MCKCGQTVLLDFSLGVFIFLIAFATLTFFWIDGVGERTNETRFFEMDLKANLAAKLLVESTGNPIDWELRETSDINFIGLASVERSLDEQKLNAFKNMDYDTARKLLNISEYDFFFEFIGETTVTAGLPTVANVNQVTVTRTVEYNGGEGIAKITLYRV